MSKSHQTPLGQLRDWISKSQRADTGRALRLLVALESDLANLREALQRYGSHTIGCELLETPVFDGDRRELVCTCGYAAFEKGAKA
jgi:hypothetical protein